MSRRPPDDGGLARTRRQTNSATLADVANLAGVSAQTVSRAVRRPLEVSEPTLERVRWAIKTIGYVPNLAASNLASNRSGTIAAIIPTISASIFAEALQGLEAVLAPSGYQLFVGSTGYDPEHEEELVRTFLGRRPEAMFIVGTQHTAAASALLKNARIPVVEAWNWTEQPIDSLVGFSNTAAIAAVVEYVTAQGYRHPTFAGSFPSGDSGAGDQQAGFVDALRRLLPGEPVRVVDSGTGVDDMATGIELLDRTLREHPETDVLMFASDVFAAGALLVASGRGIAVPGRLAITGFGDVELARYLTPSLTTVAVPNRDIGRRAGALMLERIAGATEQPRVIDLGFSVVERASA